MTVTFGLATPLRETGFTTNVSARGIGVSSNISHAPGSRLLIELRLPGGVVSSVVGVVAWSQRGSRALNLTSLMGIKVLSADDAFRAYVDTAWRDPTATVVGGPSTTGRPPAPPVDPAAPPVAKSPALQISHFGLAQPMTVAGAGSTRPAGTAPPTAGAPVIGAGTSRVPPPPPPDGVSRVPPPPLAPTPAAGISRVPPPPPPLAPTPAAGVSRVQPPPLAPTPAAGVSRVPPPPPLPTTTMVARPIPSSAAIPAPPIAGKGVSAPAPVVLEKPSNMPDAMGRMPRFEKALPAWFGIAGHLTHEAKTENLSKTGLSITARAAARKGTKLSLRIRTPLDHEAEVKAEVVWAVQGGGDVPSRLGLHVIESDRAYALMVEGLAQDPNKPK